MDYIGIPFLDKGRDPAQGLDCWGLVRVFYQTEMGIDLPSLTEDYPTTEDRETISRLVNGHRIGWPLIPIGEEQYGDIIVFRLLGSQCHMGVVMGNGIFLHVMEGMNSCLDNYRRPQWRSRVEGFHRHE